MRGPSAIDEKPKLGRFTTSDAPFPYVRVKSHSVKSHALIKRMPELCMPTSKLMTPIVVIRSYFDISAYILAYIMHHTSGCGVVPDFPKAEVPLLHS